MGECKFDKSWIGRCKQPIFGTTEYCTEHLDVKCCQCGEQATHDCEETFQFVCGAPLCDKKECKIKHHPKNYRFTPAEWSKIYDIPVTFQMFENVWESEITHDIFKQRALKEVVKDVTGELFQGLGTHAGNNMIKSSYNYDDMIIVRLKNGLAIRYKAEIG